jgi:hypothetical protein
MHSMQALASARGPVTANAAQAVGFTCCNCNGIFDSHQSMECHRRHITSHVQTPAATSHYHSLDVRPAKNNSERICPPLNSKINRFNTYNTNLIVKSSGLTLVGHGRLPTAQ